MELSNTYGKESPKASIHFSWALLSDDVIRVSLHEGRVRINWLRLDITHDSMGTGRGCCQILGVISGRSQLIRTRAHVCVNRKNEVVLRPAYALSYSNKAMRSKVYVHAHHFSGGKRGAKQNKNESMHHFWTKPVTRNRRLFLGGGP